MTRRASQAGSTTVEFAIVGLVLFIVVFGVIELGRLLFVVNALTEATRRGARMAVVCPVGDPRPASVAAFASGGSPVVYGLSSANIVVEYLDASGTPIANPTAPAGFNAIRYVRVSISGFSQSILIPTMITSIPLAGFSTTLPRESLGVPRAGSITPC